MPNKDPAARKAYDKEYRQRPEVKERRRVKARRSRRARYAEDEDFKRKCRDAHQRWIDNNPGAKENARFKSMYGLTLREYNELVEAQGGTCAICGREERVKDKRSKTGVRRLAVDHDHTTGKVRGLLCWACNTGLGKYEDNPELLRRAAAYLEGR